MSQALNKIVESEQKARETEAEYKRAQATSGRSTWLSRPVMSDFCARGIEQNTYYIPELKNAGGECQDFRQGVPDRKACADCEHRVVPDGRANDRAREEIYARMSVSATIFKASGNQAESLLGSHRQGVVARQAFELSGAHLANGELSAQPIYLDYCAALSTTDNFVVCVLRNPHHDCPAWTAHRTALANQVG